MRTSELIKIRKANQCYFLRHGSNHDIWVSPKTGKQFAIPRHKNDIKPGTAKNILKDAGIE